MATVANVPKNGPIKVEGGVQLHDSSGKAFNLPADKPVFLCRCGHSGNKPFCDGSHAKAGFESAVAAPA